MARRFGFGKFLGGLALGAGLGLLFAPDKGENTRKVLAKKLEEVVKKETKDNGEVYFTTKGIANQIEDPEISYSQIYGKVVYKFVFLSALAKLMNNQISYYILFVIVAMIISIEVMSAMFHHDDDEEGDGDRGD